MKLANKKKVVALMGVAWVTLGLSAVAGIIVANPDFDDASKIRLSGSGSRLVTNADEFDQWTTHGDRQAKHNADDNRLDFNWDERSNRDNDVVSQMIDTSGGGIQGNWQLVIEYEAFDGNVGSFVPNSFFYRLVGISSTNDLTDAAFESTTGGGNDVQEAFDDAHWTVDQITPAGTEIVGGIIDLTESDGIYTYTASFSITEDFDVLALGLAPYGMRNDDNDEFSLIRVDIIPEPASLVMVLLGGGALWYLKGKGSRAVR